MKYFNIILLFALVFATLVSGIPVEENTEGLSKRQVVAQMVCQMKYGYKCCPDCYCYQPLNPAIFIRSKRVITVNGEECYIRDTCKAGEFGYKNDCLNIV